ncbi:MAG: sigma 54-interacting transcriptional regulator, partial [Bacteroidales bacterium]|nr:sigma 54-interacting transcriptional regulator [Bacteroidales bacterium]
KKAAKYEAGSAILCYPIKREELMLGVVTVTINDENGDGKYLYLKSKIIGILDTISELIISKVQAKDYEKRIEIIEQQFEVLYSNMEDGVIVIDNKNRITKYNYKIEEYLKVRNTTLRGKLITEIFSNIDYSLLSNVKGESNIIELENKISGFEGTGLIIPLMSNNTYNGAIVNLLTNFRIDTSIYRSINTQAAISFNEIIGESETLREVVGLAKKVAPFKTNIVLYGESGTGKELFARSIHNYSHSVKDPFVAVNCAAIPETLIESELLGYEGGAFTGANNKGKPGKFEMANSGTIFLDEISEMPIFLQPKILRIIQEKKLVRLGGMKTVDLDIRIITATNKNLEELVNDGYFREDLYYRINVVKISLPPLRNRKGDIRILVDHFLTYYSQKTGMPRLIIEYAVIREMEKYHWNGNIRELQNFIEALYCISDKNTISLDVVKARLQSTMQKQKNGNLSIIENDGEIKVTPITMLIKDEIIKALNLYDNSTTGKAEVADALGISTATLYRKIKELNINQYDVKFS